MCAFLMEASKKADKIFSVPPTATAHTVHDSNRDIESMVSHLQEAEVNILDKDRTTPPFSDPVETGWQKLATTDWLKSTLIQHLVDDSDDLQEDTDSEFDHRLEVDFDCELADVVQPVYDLLYIPTSIQLQANYNIIIVYKKTNNKNC